MIHDTRFRPTPAARADAVIISAADLADATLELEALRLEAADVEDAVAQARTAYLERLVASATVVDAATGTDGVAGLGSFVRVRDETGREVDYELVGRRGTDATTAKVMLSSPVGEALLGRREGDAVRVLLPSGRQRPLTVVAVRSAPFLDRAA